MIRAICLCLVLSGCAIFDGRAFVREEVRQPAFIRAPETYTKSEIDAINAEIQCRALARNQLEINRCGIRR
jgi:hypothetical protein